MLRQIGSFSVSTFIANGVYVFTPASCAVFGISESVFPSVTPSNNASFTGIHTNSLSSGAITTKPLSIDVSPFLSDTVKSFGIIAICPSLSYFLFSPSAFSPIPINSLSGSSGIYGSLGLLSYSMFVNMSDTFIP